MPHAISGVITSFLGDGAAAFINQKIEFTRLRTAGPGGTGSVGISTREPPLPRRTSRSCFSGDLSAPVWRPVQTPSVPRSSP